MYWWNLRAAKGELRAGALGPRRVLPYLLAIVIVESVSTELSFLTPSQEDPASVRVWLIALAGAAVTALGCAYVYVRNGAAGGAQFLERLFVLGWVTAVRYVALCALAVALFFGLVVPFVPAAGEAAGEWVDVLFLLAAVAYYLYLGRHVGQIAMRSGFSEK